ncbi:hypothetical protein EVAR_63074_1, partial [Eumeta japonica]
ISFSKNADSQDRFSVSTNECDPNHLNAILQWWRARKYTHIKGERSGAQQDGEWVLEDEGARGRKRTTSASLGARWASKSVD